MAGLAIFLLASAPCLEGGEVQKNSIEAKKADTKTAVSVPAASPQKTLLSKLTGKGKTPKPLPAKKAVPGKARTKKLSGPVLPETDRSVLYNFTDHLKEAQIKLFERRRPTQLVAWGMVHENGLISFENQKRGKMMVLPVHLMGEVQKAILMELVPSSIYQFTFSAVPTGSKMEFNFTLRQISKTQAPSYAYLRILMGAKEIRRIQIAAKEPWKKEIVDFGVVSFLNRATDIRLEVHSDQSKDLRLMLISEVLP